MRPQPRWPRDTSTRIKEEVSEFRENLRHIATCFARSERASNVDPRHVEEAFAALSTLGLRRRRWLHRPEFEVAVGSLLIGAAANCPDILAAFFAGDWLRQTGVLVASISIPGIIGAFLAIHGWYRGTL